MPTPKPDQNTYRFRRTMPDEGTRASILEPADSGDGVAEMFLYDPIDSWGGWWGVSAKEFAEALAGLPEGTSEIRLHVNSPGGEVWDAMAIVNQLRAHKARTVAIVDGIAASAASIIAVSCDETLMGVGAQMMIHDAWNIAIGNEQAMLNMAARLGKDSDSLAQLYARKAGGDAADWRDLMREETWFSADEAVEAGLADGSTDTTSDAKATILPTFRYRGRAQAPRPRIPQRTAAAALHKVPVSSEPGHTHRKESDMSDKNQAGLRERLGNEADLVVDADTTAETSAEIAPDSDDADATADATSGLDLPDGVVVVDKTLYDSLKADAAAGRAARDQQIAERRDIVIKAALRAGKIAPTSKDEWRAALDRDEDGTVKLLDSLAATVPVEAMAHAGSLEDASDEDATYNRLFPKES